MTITITAFESSPERGKGQARGTAKLIQAQCCFSGTHGFESIGEEGAFHGPWAGKE